MPGVSTWRLPRALSCSHHGVYPLHTAVRWRFLIPALQLGSLKVVRSKLDYMHELPV